MNASDKYLAVFTGTKNSPRQKAWEAMSETKRNSAVQKGMAAWGAWMEKHHSAIITEGGPLGKTKRISQDGLKDVTNELAAFIVVRASSHEAATKMFENHPHFTIFPGEAVEVMPLLPIPGA